MFHCYLWFLVVYIFTPFFIEAASVSQNTNYPQFCRLAVQDEIVFKTFRRNNDFRAIVETLGSKEYGIFFLQEINKNYPDLLPHFQKICLEDKLGDPISFHFPQIGTISPTVLRYVKVAGDLQRAFGDLSSFNIVEIGGGFGGQCKIINDICGFASYAIIDLPECTPLISKYLSHFSIKNVKTINNNAVLEPKQYDLIISNYAFSEIDRAEQMHYIEMVVKLASRGYMIYNHFPSINPFSLNQFVALLQDNHKKVKVLHENPAMVGDIIIWQS